MADGTAAGPGVRAAGAALNISLSWAMAAIPLALSPALPAMAAAFGAGGDGIAQLLLTLPSIVMMVGALVAAPLAAIVGRRRLVILCLCLYAVAGGIGLVADGVGVVAAGRLCLGFVGGLLLTTSYALVGERFDGRGRMRLLGWMSVSGSLSSVVILTGGGLLVDAFGWRAAFLLYLPPLLLLPLAWKGLEAGWVAGPGSPAAAGGWAAVLRIWPLISLLVLYTIGMFMAVVQGPFLIAAQGAVEAATIGMLVSVSACSGAFGSFLFGVLRPRIGFFGMFALISLAYGLGMMLASAGGGLTVIAIGCATMGFGTGMVQPTIASEIMDRVAPALHGRAMGLNTSFLFLGQFLNPLVVGPVRDAHGIERAFLVFGVAYLAAGLAFVVARGLLGSPKRAPVKF